MEFRLPAAELRKFCMDVLAQAEVPAVEAEICAESLVDASLNGVDSHGVALLPTYVERIHSGQIIPGKVWSICRDGPATALVDGGGGIGPFLAAAAVDMAVDKAEQVGVGAVSLFNANYIGALSFYVGRAVARGLIGLCVANATPRVVPHGGARGLHGTNPVAYAAPTNADPFVFDAATGHAAARVNQARAEGRRLKSGIALDTEGCATTDPEAALAGWLLPVGGHLGYGLGLLVDLLCGGLAGSPCGSDVPPVADVNGPYGCGFFALALDPGHFAGRNVFDERSTFLADAARNTPASNEDDPVRVPGDRARLERRHRQESGIPLLLRCWQTILDRLAAYDIDVESWRRVAV